MSDIPIIAFANTDWNSLWMNRQHLLSRLAAGGRPVAYSNGVLHYSSFSRARLRQGAVLQDRVLVMNPGYFIPATHRMSLLRRAALRYHCALIRERLGIDRDAPVIGMCFDPDMIDCVDALEPALSVFHIYDSYSKMETRSAGVAATLRRIREFDIVTASSPYMYEDVIGCRPAPRFVVPNGVDYAQMVTGVDAPSPTATAIAALPGAKIGYVGSVNTRIDFDLVHALASALPTASFVFVGPIRIALLQRTEHDYAAYERLRTLPNVHFFKQVPKEELAPVIAAMDVTCIYFRIDRANWVEAVYPIKLNEYLAVGKPVLSTPLKVVREEFADVVTICDGNDDWLAALRAALTAPADAAAVAARRTVAARNDWSQRVAHFEALFARFPIGKNAPS